MKSYALKFLSKIFFFGVIMALIFVGIAVLISNKKGYLLRDVLFIQGMGIIFLGILASISENPLGFSLFGLGRINTQLINNVHPDATKMKESKFGNPTKITFNHTIATVSFIVSGIICVIVNYII
jgi:hypothetical protein